MTATSTDHSKAKADGTHTHGAASTPPEASRAARPTSFDVADFVVPGGREEEWRFSPLRVLAPLFADKLTGAGVSTTVEAPDGVSVIEVASADRFAITSAPGDRVAAASWASAPHATRVELPANVKQDAPVSIMVAGTGGDATALHIQVTAAPFAEGTVVIDHTGSATVAETVEIVAEDGAQLTVVSIHDWDHDAVHNSSHRARIGRDANLKHVVVTLGGKAVRVTPDAEFTGPGGSVDMYGLYFADAGQHQEHRLFVDHGVPDCRSRVTYKGALAGESARTVWIGDVLIRKAAVGTDTYELNRNLVLTDGARADSVPNLEIETGEIAGAGHASATGRFDEEQLFYLRSRGISEDQARKLVVRGFFADLIRQIDVADLEQRLSHAIDAELEATDD